MASNVMREEIFKAASDVVAVIRNLQASAEEFGTDNDEAIVKRLVEVLEGGFSTAYQRHSTSFMRWLTTRPGHWTAAAAAVAAVTSNV